MDTELDQLGERIAEQAAHFDAAMHRLLTDLRAFDEQGGWYAQGALSCAHWLAWRVGWDLVTARERVRVARKLAEFPAIDDALRCGEVSYSKTRAMLRVATPANEAMLLDHARLMTASHLEKLCRKYALVQRHGQDANPRDDEQQRFVRRRDTADGMIKIEAVLHPEEAELVWKMLDHVAAQTARGSVADNDYAGQVTRGDTGVRVVSANLVDDPIGDSAESQRAVMDGRNVGVTDTAAAGVVDTVAPRAAVVAPGQVIDADKRAFDRADALMSLAQRYLRGDQLNRSPIEVVLTVPVEALQNGSVVRVCRGIAVADAVSDAAEFVGVADPVDVAELGESFVSDETARRLSCDAGVVTVVEGEHGEPLSVGRKQRTISGALKRALYKRDSACTFPGCTHRIFLEGHHIKHWAGGGETSLANTALLCSAHHRYVHEYGYTIELGADHRPCFRDPRGRLVTQVPQRPARSAQRPGSFGWLQLQKMNAPLAIDAGTIACGWDGSQVGYGAIVGHLAAVDQLC